MEVDKLLLYVYVFSIGFAGHPLVDWLNLFATDLTAYCAPPSELRVQMKLLDWKVLALRMTKYGDFTKSHSKNHSQHDFIIDSCVQRHIFESRDNISDNMDQVIDYGNLDFVQCQNGWFYEPSKEVSLRAKFDLVCHREKYLLLGHVVLGLSSLLGMAMVYILNRMFDVRWLCIRKVRLLTIIFCLTMEVIAFSPLDIHFSTFILVRTLASFFYIVFFAETVWALSMRFGEELYFCQLEASMSMFSGYIFSSVLWSSLITSISDWRLLGAYSIGISNSIVILLTAIIDDEPLTMYMPSSIQRINTISKRSDQAVEDVIRENLDQEEDQLSVYRSCEEQVVVSLTNSESKLISMLNRFFISIFTILINMYYFLIIFAPRDQNCWWRRYGKVLCFTEKSMTQAMLMVLIISLQIILGMKEMKKSGLITSIVSMVGIGSLILNRVLDSDQALDDDLFSFYLGTFGLVCCLTNGIEMTSYVTSLRSHAVNAIWVISTALAWSIAPLLKFWLINDHKSREIIYFCCSFLIAIVGSLEK